jgi:hypothetical protein
MKVSVLGFMVLLMTMSVASVAMGEEILNIDIENFWTPYVFVGDNIEGYFTIQNIGSTVATNLEADVVCPLTKPERIHYVIGDLNPGEISGYFPFRNKAVQLGASECSVSIGPGNRGSIASQREYVIEPLPEPIPEFPTVALPTIAIVGLIFLLQRRKAN